jgi:hypothetical protein
MQNGSEHLHKLDAAMLVAWTKEQGRMQWKNAMAGTWTGWEIAMPCTWIKA